MRYNSKSAILILLLSITFLIFCTNKSETLKTKKQISAIENLPNIQIMGIDSAIILIKSKIPANKFILLYYFSPDCMYCLEETKMILSNTPLRNKTYVIFLSATDLKEIKKYDSVHRISESNVGIIGKDIEHSFTKYVSSGSFPLLALYNPNQKLKKVLIGNITGEQINEIMEEEDQ